MSINNQAILFILYKKREFFSEKYTFSNGSDIMLENDRMMDTMLIRFKFKNYKSFADETILDLTATNIKEHTNSLIEKNGIKILPMAAIFGANASGKTNLFLAFKSMCADVINRYEKNENHSLIKPYIFNQSLEKSSTEYEINIIIGDKEYRYGFVRNQVKVYEEWLFANKFSKNTKAKEKMIFYRKGKKLLTEKLNQKEDKEFAYINSMIEENELLITAIGRRKRSDYSNIYEWFLHTSRVQDFSNDNDEVMSTELAAEFLCKYSSCLEDVVNLLKKFDNSITDIKIILEKDSELNEVYAVYSYHLDSMGKEIKIPFESESSGTKKIFALASWLFYSLMIGMVLWVDELDAKLHPLILRYIIKLYSDREFNTGDGQLVFSSHNLVCLDSSDLRRDEIWFVEKNNQVSTIYSLYDFKEDETTIRSDLSFGKHYLCGRFGAIPFQNVGE